MFLIFVFVNYLQLIIITLVIAPKRYISYSEVVKLEVVEKVKKIGKCALACEIGGD